MLSIIIYCNHTFSKLLLWVLKRIISMRWSRHFLYLFIYLFIHIHVFVHIVFIHVRVVHMLLSTFAMLKSWPYIYCLAGDDVTSFDVTLVTLWHTSVSDNVKMYNYQYAKFDQNICVVQEL